MNIKIILALLFLSSFTNGLFSQSGTISGTVVADGNLVEFAQIIIDEINVSTLTNSKGKFSIAEIPFGNYSITASYIGFKKVNKEINIDESSTDIQVDFAFTEATLQIENIVVTATKTPRRQTNSPVIVNVINSQTLSNVQACNLSEGLKFQPGLRVETDCQTCNYTQLRMNGLAGGYSQILINGRPIFSPLTGLYGLEQIPANMIDRIEVVRGGGSSLYGSSAIGGTVNVITKIPRNNSYSMDYTYQSFGNQTNDHLINGNATLVSKSKNSGISFLLHQRNRGMYDENDDNFSEIPLLNNTSFGANVFFLPNENQKLEINLSKIYEYRYGGEMVYDKPAYLALQSEERTHNIWMGSADYQINFNNDNSSLIAFMAWQHTDREHYTGIQPDENTTELDEFLANPPYGNSVVQTYTLGTQLNHKIKDFFIGTNVFTLGTEYVYDDVIDEIPSYEYLIDQMTTDIGAFLQSDWEILPQLTLLSGVRIDKHNLVDKPIVSPRASALLKLKGNTQFRISYGTGFRAPQAFDTDLHIAFAAGGVSRISLSPELQPEKSQSISTSINYDKAMETWIAGFTIEGFYNRLNQTFILQPIGQDQFGERFEKQNGSGATVKGITLEGRGNYNQKLQLECGFTLQSSLFDESVKYIEDIPGIRQFTRTPNQYGYGILTFTPNPQWNASINYVYTGSMEIPHFAGASNQLVDEIVTSRPFSDLGGKLGYTFPLKAMSTNLEMYCGVKNIFNAYQNDFDIGKNRDSNYIYGPGQPRTFFIGLKLKSM